MMSYRGPLSKRQGSLIMDLAMLNHKLQLTLK